jgi:hypothetical protein
MTGVNGRCRLLTQPRVTPNACGDVDTGFYHPPRPDVKG